MKEFAFNAKDALEVIERMRSDLLAYVSDTDIPYSLKVDLYRIGGELAVTAYGLKHDWIGEEDE